MGLRAARRPTIRFRRASASWADRYKEAEAINTPNKHGPLPEGSVSQD